MTVEQWLGKDNQLGIDIWHRKYQKNDETFDEWLNRVSGGNKEVKELIIQKKFLFGGRILSNRGITDGKVTYSNCYVIAPPEDNIESIFDSRKKLARTYSYGGGCGIDISKLAPAGAKVRNQAEQTTGAVSFMEGYSQTTEEIGQNGRRGALMISLDCHHPDLIDFINIKAKEGAVTKANISVRVTDDFMQAVENDEDWEMSFTRPETGETITKTIRAKEIFHQLCQNNSDWAEPGILYWDKIENWNLLSEDPSFHYAGTNPCAEEPLPAGGSCLLGSINLSEFVKNKQFDFQSLKKTVDISVKTLNDVLDEGLPLHPLQEQRDSVRNWRQIGLGVMGIADMLIKMELPYDSDEAIRFCDKIGEVMAREAIAASATLAFDYGCYPEYDKFYLNESKFYQSHVLPETRDYVYLHGLRNSQLLTIAPTGTLSTMLGISGGIEPIYANSYTRKTESLHGKDVYYKVYTPIVENYMKEHGITDEDQLPDWFVTSSTIDPMKRIKMQATWQKHIDASISSTINLPNETTVEDIEKLYMEAWKQGLKGLTIYRDGCKRSGILSHENKTESIEPQPQTFVGLGRGDIVECSNDLVGKKRKLTTGCGSLHVLAFFDPVTGDMQEVYLNKGSTGGCVDADTEYFNGKEWKKISQYKEGSFEPVLQYNKDGTASLTIPHSYIVNENVNTLKHFYNNTGLDMVLSTDHKMFLYKNYIKFMSGIRKKLTTETITVQEFLENSSKNRHIPTTFTMTEKGIPIPDNIIRLLVAVYADGTFDGHKIIINVKKTRKKERLRQLLINCDIGWTEKNIHNTDYTVFYIHPVPSCKQWFIDKQFTSKWYDCNDEQLRIVADECVYWDGSLGDGNRMGEYFSSKKEEVDFIQFALTRLGYRATISLNNSTNSKQNSYRVRWTKQNVHGLSTAKIEDYKTIDGKSYCFTVDSGFLVLRRNGRIFITGNCANFMTGLSRTLSLLCRAGVDVRTIKDQLDSTGTCPSYATRAATKHDTSKGSCCPMAVGNALVEMWEEMQDDIGEGWEDQSTQAQVSTPNSHQLVTNSTALCPECGEPLVFEGGCNSCKSCGYSKCN